MFASKTRLQAVTQFETPQLSKAIVEYRTWLRKYESSLDHSINFRPLIRNPVLKSDHYTMAKTIFSLRRFLNLIEITNQSTFGNYWKPTHTGPLFRSRTEQINGVYPWSHSRESKPKAFGLMFESLPTTEKWMPTAELLRTITRHLSLTSSFQ